MAGTMNSNINNQRSDEKGRIIRDVSHLTSGVCMASFCAMTTPQELRVGATIVRVVFVEDTSLDFRKLQQTCRWVH